MHKYITLFFSVMLFLTACGKKKAPDGILSEPQMVSLLTDVHIADGSLYGISQVPDSIYKYGMASYQAVFKKHHINETEFKKNLKYYSTQPEQLMEIYEKVDAALKGKLDSVNKKPKNNALPKE
jgi:hypothetical protein